jgi:outer membrane protein assembly factor BamB
VIPLKKRKMAISLLTSLVLSTGFASQQYAFASGQFVQGDQYEQGAYDLNAQQPMSFNWTRNSRFNAIDSNPNLKWKFSPTTTYKDFDSSAAVGSDGTIYTGSGNGYFYAFNPDGTVKWNFNTKNYSGYDVGVSSPVIASDGTIYVGAAGLFAFNPDGTLKWLAQLNAATMTPAIDNDGTIYVTTRAKKLYAINPDGTIKWEFALSNYADGTPAIAEDGTIYIATFVLSGSGPAALHAINPDGTEKWRYDFTPGFGFRGYGSVAIASDGTIYVGNDDKNLYAINPDGTLKWKFPTGGKITATPVIGVDGTIYFGSFDYNFYAVNPNGTLKWSYNAGFNILGSPILDKEGDVIFSTGNVGTVYCLKPDGSLKWKLDGFSNVHTSPSIMEDGTIIIGDFNGLSAIGGLVDSTDPCETIHQLEELINSGLKSQSDIDEANNLLQTLRARLDQYQSQIDAAQQ